MPLFSSYFHLPCPRGVEHAAQEQAVARERKRLMREKALKHMERQKHSGSLSDDDNDDDDDDDGSFEG
jgi:hypothetical protein